MRYELKYAITNVNVADVTSRILMHPASFSKVYEDRQVNNIYLDTPAFHCFYQNIEGQPRRSKMRLRWYGDQQLPTNNSILEIKQKDKELGWKDTFKITNHSIINATSLMSAINAQGVSQGNLIPILHNTYKRSYYLSQNGLFRITIDSLQAFSIPFSNMQALPTETYPVIVELKFEQEHHIRSREITDYIPFRQTKNSKYTTGVEALYF
ncbi:MAG: VTC domain-containing protein [Saprospiraceae bacterium]